MNLSGAWLGCQGVIPHMGTTGGSIVDLSSKSRWGAFGQANYAPAKAGLVGLTRTVAIEQARHKVRVNAVAPGTTTTAIVEAAPEEVRKGWLRNHGVGAEADGLVSEYFRLNPKAGPLRNATPLINSGSGSA